VAVGTLPRRHRVGSGKREIHHAVIEGRRRPATGRMALRAIAREVRRHMVRIGGVLEICLVASNADGGGQIVIIVGMAVGTLPRRHRVHSGQGETGRIMVEFRVQPVVRAVAGIASHGKLARRVIRVVGVQIIGLVARIAVGRHGLELAVGRTLMAGIAVDRGVSSGQGKAVVVLLHLLNRNCPTANRMALLAIRAELPLMNVSVAVLAPQTYIREYRFHMTLDAGHGLVHAAQGIPCLVVIEFGNGADRLPRTRRVAVLARNIQIAVWTVGFCVALRLQACRVPGKRQQKCHDQMKHAPRRQHDLSLNLGRGGIRRRQP